MPEQQAPSASVAIQEIPIDQITPSPFQCRKSFDEESLKQLAQTMKNHGLENAVLARPSGDRYELVAGERRWRAAKLLGWPTLTAKIEAADTRRPPLRVLLKTSKGNP